MLTAETVTTTMLRRLRLDARKRGDQALVELCTRAMAYAVSGLRGDSSPANREAAAACAEILNRQGS